MTHKRNTVAMRAAPRCGARTRTGARCQAPAIRARARCRKHGGARGSGAQQGNRNALTHGLYTAEMRAWRREVWRVWRETKDER